MLVTVADIRARVNFVDSDITDTQIDPLIKSAARRIKAWVGATAYADAESQTPTNAERAGDLENAEAALTLHFLLLWLQTNLTPRGMVKSAKDDGSVVVQYFSPSEVREFQDMYFAQAEALCKPYQLTSDAISSVELL